jgi:hypothetical protein
MTDTALSYLRGAQVIPTRETQIRPALMATNSA